MTSFSKKLCASSTHTDSYTVTFNIIFEARWMKWTWWWWWRRKKSNKKWCAYFSTRVSSHIIQFTCLQYTCSIYIKIIGACVLVQANREFYFLSFAQQKLIICIFTQIHMCARTNTIYCQFQSGSTEANPFYGLNIFRRQAVKSIL